MVWIANQGAGAIFVVFSLGINGLPIPNALLALSAQSSSETSFGMGLNYLRGTLENYHSRSPSM